LEPGHPTGNHPGRRKNEKFAASNPNAIEHLGVIRTGEKCCDFFRFCLIFVIPKTIYGQFL
jgi:hypothetical protein